MEDMDAVRFDGERKFRLADVKTDDTGDFHAKADAEEATKRNIQTMITQQGQLFAQGRTALLLIFQAMDAAGKDGVIRHVMSGLNPQGTEVHSFKQPTAEELGHDYMWRVTRRLPARGMIGIFNRSYYEEVLVVRVHDLIASERIPEAYTGHIWERRFEQIRNYEKYMRENGIVPVKFFLNVSKEEQKKRLLSRIENKAKNWKFSESDILERRYWDEYQHCYEEAIDATATRHAPWYVIPADKKWYARYLVSAVVARQLCELHPEYPEMGAEQQALLEKYRVLLRQDG